MSDRREQLIRIIIGEGMMRRDVATDVADAIIAAGWTIGHPYQTACGGAVPYTIVTTINDSVTYEHDSGR